MTAKAHYLANKDDREAWASQFDYCFWCGRHLHRRDMKEIHEVESRERYTPALAFGGCTMKEWN